MKPFTHYNARSVKEATGLLAQYEGKAKVNAGGTDLLGTMRGKCMPRYPEAVINIKTINGLDYIKTEKKGLKIGALTLLADIAVSPIVKEDYTLLAEAVHSVATPHIRNMATIGGNLAQDVRCWYYRYPQQIGGPIVCLRKGGKICNALAGDNRYHSLFGAARPAEYPCASHCPARTDIPSYLSKVRKGDLASAARILMEYNPLPAVTGRVCPVFCEPECNRSEFDDAVGIECIERGVGDYVLKNASEFYAPPQEKSGKKIAVVGSGPAGLAAAFYLRKAGHKVTVYEKLPEAGGMLFYSIPPYRLPKDLVRRQVRALKDMGISFEVGVDVGKDVSITDLKKRFDAIFLAGGTWKSLRLGVPGEDAKGVCYALDYLKAINSGEKIPLGKKVIVIGGGSVAIDAARTARRTGAEEVHLICLECRDLTSKDRMLARDNEILEAEEEGIIIHPSLGIKEIVKEDGKAVGLETITCLSVREPEGTFNPQYDATCTALSFRADSIIVAIGQTVDQSFFVPGLIYDRKGTMSVDPSTLETDVLGVFASGDAVSGPSTVIQAVASAREAARLIGASFKGVARPVGAKTAEPDFSEPVLSTIPRARVHELLPAQRIKGIEVEDIRGLTMDEIETEAGRCFNCGCLAVGPSDVGIALVCLNAHIVTTTRTIDARTFFAANATSSHVLEADELIKEIRIPRPPSGSRQRYEKFTLRTPIDFAVVSVASVLTVSDGICKEAHITLGGVAPAPIRAEAAERVITGRAIDEKTALKAAEQAVGGAKPLSMNTYKVEITKALVKRALLR
jgi:NADPH-dependent glutamate synthase beta subunit-like oxidoreductase